MNQSGPSFSCWVDRLVSIQFILDGHRLLAEKQTHIINILSCVMIWLFYFFPNLLLNKHLEFGLIYPKYIIPEILVHSDATLQTLEKLLHCSQPQCWFCWISALWFCFGFSLSIYWFHFGVILLGSILFNGSSCEQTLTVEWFSSTRCLCNPYQTDGSNTCPFKDNADLFLPWQCFNTPECCRKITD